MADQMIIRLEERTKKKLAGLARAEGKNSSQVIRELVRDYIVQRDLAGCIDDLWARAGRKLAASGRGPKDIPGAILASRKGRR